MILLPHTRLEGTTSLTAPELRDRLLRFLEDPPPLEVPPPLLPMWGKRYAGQVDQQGFRLVALTKFKQPYLPVFTGGFVPEGSRTRVQGVLRADGVELALAGMLILALVAMSRSLVVAGLCLAFHAMAYFFGFLPHENSFTAWLERLPGWEWSRRTRS